MNLIIDTLHSSPLCGWIRIYLTSPLLEDIQVEVSVYSETGKMIVL
jgi:hypothetical protein